MRTSVSNRAGRPFSRGNGSKNRTIGYFPAISNLPGGFLLPDMKLIFACAVLCLPALVRADYTPDFAAPPYVLEGTILGVDGWQNRIPTDKDTSDTARVVPVAWNQDKPAILLVKSNLANVAFPPAEGDRVSITFSLAVDAPGKVAPGRQFRIFFGTTPIGEIYYDAGDTQGFGYQGGGDGRSGGTICVPKEDIVDSSYYTFSLDINFADQTYDITVTGKKSDGTPLAFKAEAVPFLAPSKGTPGTKGVYVLSGSSLNVFLGSLAVAAK